MIVENVKRKNYLDNIRWITIVLVVIFHIFFYYNNIGIDPMFKGLPKYVGQISFGGIFQYFVYPWFMLLLFVVAGMSARYSLRNKTSKQFLRTRVDKLLVPSTLGILSFGWIGGYIILIHSASQNMPKNTPEIARVIITFCSGIGALWFCHVLLIASLLLVFVRTIIRCFHGTDDSVCRWFESKTESMGKSILLLIVLYFILWGGSHILNMPLITSYRNGIYIPAFLAGYYIFSNDSLIEKLKKLVLPIFVLSLATGIFYMIRCYGLSYTDISVLSRWDVNLYAFFMVLLSLGAGARFLDVRNTFTDYMKNHSFGIYVLHIPVMLVVNYCMVGSKIPMPGIYLIEGVSAFAFSLLLFEIISRIPVLRYWIFGIRKRKMK